MRKVRKNYSAEEKVALLKKHFVEQVPVSDLCDRYELQPTVFYRWQKQFFEHGAAAFQKQANPRKGLLEQKVKVLEQKLVQKNEVLAELMEEHVALKKSLGEI
jgi:transposase-like protein